MTFILVGAVAFAAAVGYWVMARIDRYLGRQAGAPVKTPCKMHPATLAELNGQPGVHAEEAIL